MPDRGGTRAAGQLFFHRPRRPATCPAPGDRQLLRWRATIRRWCRSSRPARVDDASIRVLPVEELCSAALALPRSPLRFPLFRRRWAILRPSRRRRASVMRALAASSSFWPAAGNRRPQPARPRRITRRKQGEFHGKARLRVIAATAFCRCRRRSRRAPCRPSRSHRR